MDFDDAALIVNLGEINRILHAFCNYTRVQFQFAARCFKFDPSKVATSNQANVTERIRMEEKNKFQENK